MAATILLTGSGPNNWSYTFTDLDGPYTFAGTTADYNSVHYYAGGDPNPSPNHVQFFTIFRIAIGPLTTASLGLPITIGGPGGGVFTPLVATPQNLVAYSHLPRNITLGATGGNGTITYTVPVAGVPLHGAVTGVLPAAVYTSNIGFVGGDTFTFRAHDGVWPDSDAIITLDVQAYLASQWKVHRFNMRMRLEETS